MARTNRGFWENVFKVTPEEPLSREDEAWLDSISQGLLRRGLREPAILFLESTKPLHFIAGQAVRFLDPIFSIVVPDSQLERLAKVLERRDAAEKMIRYLESHEPR